MSIKDMPFVTVEQVNALRTAALRIENANAVLLRALGSAESLLSFHEGCAKPEFDGAHPTIRVNGEDWEGLLRQVREAIATGEQA